METLKLFLVCIWLLKIISGARSEPQSPDQLCWGRVSVIKLNFYSHDIFRGNNQTVYSVARSIATDQVPSKFGVVYVGDVLMTSGPEIESGKLGRIQGHAAFSDFEETAWTMTFNVLFTHGEYKGSSLTIVGRNPINEELRQLSIVGGTGAFQLVWGYILVKTYYVVDPGAYSVTKYEAVVYNATFTD
ncbi:dirigent protein 1-like [Andrographis paniculata]|uniref:dirigent protein 1-like n=1 Tax=Andrographis paniculata TaxID=175694 RepID=UPI0021E8BCAF|nr:dirigent protein 1-like [Andrographis paniculata]